MRGSRKSGYRFCPKHPRALPWRIDGTSKHGEPFVQFRCPKCIAASTAAGRKAYGRQRELARMSPGQRAFELESWDAYAARTSQASPELRTENEFESAYRNVVTIKPARSTSAKKVA